MVVKDFLEFIRDITKEKDSTIMVLRTTGPDGVEDFEKANQIYSAYHVNLQPESPELFDKLLYNEFTFVEFEDEQKALNFALENLPKKADKTVDTDYFVQVFIFSSGGMYYANDSLEGLSETVKPI
jgi:hypothetical protein